MSPIFNHVPVGSNSPVEVDKAWWFLIDPSQGGTTGFIDMTNFSIDGQDFILSVNNVMTTTYNGSGGSPYILYNQSPSNTVYQYGWMFYYGKFSNLPQPTILDPNGNLISNSWFCDDSPYGLSTGDYLGNIILEVSAVHKILEFADVSFYSPYLANQFTGYPNDGYNWAIDFTRSNNNVPVDVTLPTAAATIRNILDPLFLNNINVSISLTGSRYRIRIENLYSWGAGSKDTNWRQGYRAI